MNLQGASIQPVSTTQPSQKSIITILTQITQHQGINQCIKQVIPPQKLKYSTSNMKSSHTICFILTWSQNISHHLASYSSSPILRLSDFTLLLHSEVHLFVEPNTNPSLDHSANGRISCTLTNVWNAQGQREQWNMQLFLRLDITDTSPLIHYPRRLHCRGSVGAW